MYGNPVAPSEVELTFNPSFYPSLVRMPMAEDLPPLATVTCSIYRGGYRRNVWKSGGSQCLEGDLDLMQTFAIIKIPPGASFSYNGSDADFRLRPDLDHLNFCELDRGTLLGTLGRGASRRLEVLALDGGATEARCLEYVGGEIRLSRRAIPAMLTLDATAVRLDCVGYLMHRIGRDGRRVAD